MIRVILLDTGPLGLVTHPRAERNREVATWLVRLLAAGVSVRVPEICDFELRRELLRASKYTGIQRLDDLKKRIGYLPLTTETMLLAAQLWADIRNIGQPTATDPALDIDVILAAQAKIVENSNQGPEVVVATTNVGHLSRFVTAKTWDQIRSDEEGAEEIGEETDIRP